MARDYPTVQREAVERFLRQYLAEMEDGSEAPAWMAGLRHCLDTHVAFNVSVVKDEKVRTELIASANGVYGRLYGFLTDKDIQGQWGADESGAGTMKLIFDLLSAPNNLVIVTRMQIALKGMKSSSPDAFILTTALKEMNALRDCMPLMYSTLAEASPVSGDE
jgi:hypothetical protein